MNFNELFKNLGRTAISDSVINEISLDKICELATNHAIKMNTALTIAKRNIMDKSIISTAVETAYRIDNNTTLVIRTSLVDNFTYIDFQSDSFEDGYQYALKNYESLRPL